jgi:hypothetical protein
MVGAFLSCTNRIIHATLYVFLSLLVSHCCRLLASSHSISGNALFVFNFNIL